MTQLTERGEGKHQLLVWGVLGLAIAGGLTLYLRHSSRLDRDLASMSAELAALKREPKTTIIREVHMDTDAQRWTNERPADAAPTEAPTAERSSTSPEEVDAQRVRRGAARMRMLADTLTREPEDRAWAREASSRLQEVYSGPEYAPLALSTTCRSTMCRVEFSYRDAETGRPAAEKFLSSPPWDGFATAQFDLEAGSGSVYFAREGGALPSLPAEATE